MFGNFRLAGQKVECYRIWPFNRVAGCTSYLNPRPVLRHTFASHFVMNGGNILALQKVLGHRDLKTTMIYAHLSPEHLQEVKILNPLSRLKLG